MGRCAVDGKAYLLDGDLLAELATGVVPDHDDRVPVLLAVSDNGPQMTSDATAVFMAAARIAQHFGRPSTPNDQAWIESFFGHVKGENPHLEKIRDPGELKTELARCREPYNTIRLHEGIGYVTPHDERPATARRSEPPDEPASTKPENSGLPSTGKPERIPNDPPPVLGNYQPGLVHLLRHTLPPPQKDTPTHPRKSALP